MDNPDAGTPPPPPPGTVKGGKVEIVIGNIPSAGDPVAASTFLKSTYHVYDCTLTDKSVEMFLCFPDTSLLLDEQKHHPPPAQLHAHFIVSAADAAILRDGLAELIEQTGGVTATR